MINTNQIQPATAADYPAIRALLRSCQLPYEELDEQGQQAFLVLRKERDLIGTVGLEMHRPDGLLRSLAVSESYRGKGYGKALVDRLETVADDQEIKTLYLLTTTAEAFFYSLGYRSMDRESAPPSIQQTSEFAQVCPGTATCMKKELQNT